MKNVVVSYIENTNPRECDILVFDKARNCWRQESRVAFLSKTIEKQKEMEAKIKSLTERIESLELNLIELAKIIKENKA